MLEATDIDQLTLKAASVKTASRRLARASADLRRTALMRIAAAVRERETDILSANETDCGAAERAAEASGRAPLLDRLRLTDQRVQAMARDVEAVAALPDPVGEEIDPLRLAQRDQGRDPRAVGCCAGRLPLQPLQNEAPSREG